VLLELTALREDAVSLVLTSLPVNLEVSVFRGWKREISTPRFDDPAPRSDDRDAATIARDLDEPKRRDAPEASPRAPHNAGVASEMDTDVMLAESERREVALMKGE
jgi:hypothetical protein